MARTGSFQGPSDQYGAPLAFVVPPDSDFAKGRYDAALMDPSLHLTQIQMDDLQAQIDELYSLEQIAKDLP